MTPIRFFAGREPGDPPSDPPVHSPGPWISHDIDVDTDPDCGSWVVDLPDDGNAMVTRLYFGDMETNTGTDVRNADLVAAAPDLLQAGLAMAKATTPAEVEAAYQLLGAAIAKATRGDA